MSHSNVQLRSTPFGKAGPKPAARKHREDEDDGFEPIDASGDNLGHTPTTKTKEPPQAFKGSSGKSTVLSGQGSAATGPKAPPPGLEPPAPAPYIPLGHSISSAVNTVSMDDFEILTVIGKGSFGKVVQAKKKSDGRIMAIKIIKKLHIFMHEQQFHTITERTILAAAPHPLMPRLHYAFQTDAKLYMAIDLANGGELFYHLRQEVRLSYPVARFIIAEIVDVIDHLHHHHIVYRDLKPENVLIQRDGHILLIDFGLAKILDESTEETSNEMAQPAAPTRGRGGRGRGGAPAKQRGGTTDTYCGTEEYMAPEVMTGQVYGKAVDWWNVGYLFYVMLVGDHPFKADNPYETQRKTLMCQYRIPSYVPPIARDFISKLLVADPSRRLGSIHMTSAPSPALGGQGAAGIPKDGAVATTSASALSEGRGLSGGAEVKAHPMFEGFNFDDLRQKKVTPPFIPSLPEGDLDISLIDEEFTCEAPVDSPPPSPPPNMTARDKADWEQMNKVFEGFDFNEDLLK